MNSPVSCLPDPIQNMVKKGKIKNKNLKRKIPRPLSSMASALAPASYGVVNGRKPRLPEMTQRGGRCLVRNYELVTTFPTGNTAFQAAGGICNPGLAINFPWLSTIAAGFQKFRWQSLRYFFSGSCPTTTTGKTWIQLSYDALDSAPTTLALTMQSEDASTGPAWFGGAVNDEKAFDKQMSTDSNIYVDFDPKKVAQPYHYVRTSNADTSIGLSGTPTGGLGTLVTSGAVYDTSAIPVRVYYGNSAVTSSTVPGELYVAYVCELFEPVAPADNL